MRYTIGLCPAQVESNCPNYAAMLLVTASIKIDLSY